FTPFTQISARNLLFIFSSTKFAIERECVSRACHGNIKKTALFFSVNLLVRFVEARICRCQFPREFEKRFFVAGGKGLRDHSQHEHVLEFQAFGCMNREQFHRILAFAAFFWRALTLFVLWSFGWCEWQGASALT